MLISTNEVILMKNFVTKEVYQVDQGGYMDEFEDELRRLNVLLHILTKEVILMDFLLPSRLIRWSRHWVLFYN